MTCDAIYILVNCKHVCETFLQFYTVLVFCFSSVICKIDVLKPIVFHLERRNSKDRSGYVFFLVLEILFLQVPQRELKNIHRWLIYQSKAISLYFGTGKNSNQIFHISVENRQTKFNFLKFCVY